MRARGIPAGLELPPVAAMDDAYASLSACAEAAARTSTARQDVAAQIGSGITFDGKESHRAALRQVHGGILPPGAVMPYASLILRNDHASRLKVDGEFPDRPELRGGGTEVFVEEVLVGRLEFVCGPSPDARSFSRCFELPEEVRAREFVSVRFVSSDWVLDGDHLRHCVSFLIRQVELQP